MTQQNLAYPVDEVDTVVIRFAGDSGDGMQLVGDQFTSTSALMGDDVATLPDYPSEIRAPAGTIGGVSGFQVCFGTSDVFTPGDSLDFLVAMNPAALRANMPYLKPGSTLILNEDSFVARNIEKAGYATNPLETNELAAYRVLRVPMVKETQEALGAGGLGAKQVDRCKNFFALGLSYWLFNRDIKQTQRWIIKKFGTKPDVLDANQRAFEAGLNYGKSGKLVERTYATRAKVTPRGAGVYRQISGNTATAYGLLAAAKRANLPLFLGSYPITPATDIMQVLQQNREFCNVLQAEDEIAGIGSAIGAAFGGALAATSTSGPGFSLKTEFINLAVMTELPLVIVDVQRAGPSTGLPTKTEQSDLMQAMFGRHGESPLAIVAASSPRDCFDATIEAARIALKYMTPVVLLTDGYVGNGSEVWRVPDLDELPILKTHLVTNPEGFKPYSRDPETLARPWAAVGTPGLEHRIGGLEKEDGSGVISHSPANHQRMTDLRAEKIERITQDIPKTEVYGDPDANVLVLGWGSTRGVIEQAVGHLNKRGVPVAAAHLRHMNPLPPDLKALMLSYKRVLVPEINSGQLAYHLRAKYLIDIEQFNKVEGQPFRADEIEAKILSMPELTASAKLTAKHGALS